MIGKKLANRYEIMERIGGGGMAIVYRALDSVLNRYVSVKVLRPQFVTDEDFVRRFRREAQAAASLSHPNVVNIYDVGMEDEIYYIVMEYINGKTLKEIIQERAPLPVTEAVDIAKQICHALQHAHEHQIVHRDIKPHNIMIGKDGHVKVTDFGIARAVTSNTITHNGSVLGSVHYFSPEQARGGLTDLKSDIYSLGVVLYEMLTGELPFSGESPISVALKHLQDYFVEPRQLNPQIPQSIENVILKSLAKDPEARYQSAKEMFKDLEKALIHPNVEKFVPPDPTAYTQPTMQIPAAAFQGQNTGGQVTAPWNTGATVQEPEKKKNIWKTLGMIVGILLLTVVGLAAGFTLAPQFLGGKEVNMPKVEGMKYEEAVETLVLAGFKEKNIKKEEMKDPGKDANGNPRPPLQAGFVFEQNPEPASVVKTTRTVTLKVSTGADTVLMPNLEGKTEQEARNELAKLFIDPDTVIFKTETHKDVEAGKVFKQSPSPQVQIFPGQTKIEVYVSSGQELVEVPDLRNKSLPDALAKLREAGFQLGTVVYEFHYSVPANSVIRQEPFEIGKQAKKDSKIDLWVSKGMPPDTKERNYEVTVRPEPGKSVTVMIKVSDVRGKGQVVINNEQISSEKKYQVKLFLAPTIDGEIEVYENGVLKEKTAVKYR